MPEPVKLASRVIVGAASVGNGVKAAKARLLNPAKTKTACERTDLTIRKF